MSIVRKGHDEAAVVVPVTIPYVRFAPHSTHWFAARALAELLQQSGLDKRALVSGFGMMVYDRGRCSGAAILTKGSG